jgi:hypothetical protein
MSTRASISILILSMVNAVLFGIGAIIVLSIPALNANANILLPVIIMASFVISPFISWTLAPRLRARWQSSSRSSS